ncbi:MAG: K(+)-transporting ATPase subunit C [Verrucomicrobiales bacterium]|nr:K(+)-transporting ATPase subunit C [Verrucomicrobiales bacterium]
MKEFLSQLRGALAATVVLAAVTCGLYPMAVWVLAQTLFPNSANGSLLVDGSGTVRGSRRIGQGFTSPRYFLPRPSAAGVSGYDATASGGSNLGPLSMKLRDAVRDRIAAYRAMNGLPETESVPADAVTASGSGLDPHISLRNASLQAPRVARLRGLDPARVQELIRRHTEFPAAGFLGEPGVNVLTLNRALDAR